LQKPSCLAKSSAVYPKCKNGVLASRRHCASVAQHTKHLPFAQGDNWPRSG
jgi:hypothetical protein